MTAARVAAALLAAAAAGAEAAPPDTDPLWLVATLALILAIVGLPVSIYAAITARRALEARQPDLDASNAEGARILERLADDA